MKKIVVFWLALAISAACAAPVVVPNKPEPPPSKIMVVYPKEGGTISAPSTFLIGSVPAGRSVTSNGLPVRVNDQGFFAHVVALKPGKNTFTLVLNDADPADAASKRTLSVTREVPPKSIPANVMKIDQNSI